MLVTTFDISRYLVDHREALLYLGSTGAYHNDDRG